MLENQLYLSNLPLFSENHLPYFGVTEYNILWQRFMLCTVYSTVYISQHVFPKQRLCNWDNHCTIFIKCVWIITPLEEVVEARGKTLRLISQEMMVLKIPNIAKVTCSCACTNFIDIGTFFIYIMMHVDYDYQQLRNVIPHNSPKQKQKSLPN